MYWYNDHLISKTEKKKLTETIKNICKKYKVKLPGCIEISKRLRASDGLYKWDHNNTDGHRNKISLAYAHYKKFGIDSLIKILKHEIAHHICSMRGKDVDHGPYFKDICFDIGACMNEFYATGKYKNLAYSGINTRYLWQYECPGCSNGFRTKKKLQETGRGCAICGYPLLKFYRWRL